MKILVFIEQRDGKIKSAAFEALTLAHKLAGSAANVAGVIVGNGIAGLTSQMQGFGADTIYTAEHAQCDKYNIGSYAAAVQAAIKDFGPQMVLGIASPMGRDIFPRLAARMDAAILTDVIDVQVNGAEITGLKPMFAGKCRAQLTTQNAALTFVSLRANVIAANKSGQGAATAKAVNFEIPGNLNLVTTEIRKGAGEKADLTEAHLIISGGRALGSADNFKILNECADVIGATVGASRAAVDSGYAAHSMQVGQTGKTVNPSLYIACGISGSIQHMAGMRTSKTIVAINTDPEAPIFTVADYGIVADLFEAVPILTKKFKALLGH